MTNFKWVKHLALYFQESGNKSAPLMLFLHVYCESFFIYKVEIEVCLKVLVNSLDYFILHYVLITQL